MKSPRFVVGEVEGLARPSVAGNATPGLSVVVTDSAHAHRIVGQFRSETRVSGGRGRPGYFVLGVAGARAAGRELADRLNGAA